MSIVSEEIKGYMENSSWIRKMFEAGIELKKKYGESNVYDFSLGNPDLPPPPEVKAALHEIADECAAPFSLGYMPNAGFAETRNAIAAKVTEEQSIVVSGSRVVVTVGAAGGINAVFRAILQPGDEVLVPAPYFVEYGFYAANYGAKLRAVPSHPDDFSLDIEAFGQALNEKTRAVIVNSPNNPTGRIYSKVELVSLAAMLEKQSAKNGRPILLIADEPYRFLNFSGAEIPSILPIYDHSAIIGSFSKNLCLAGERVGYVAVGPAFPDAEEFIAAVVMTNRILGFVNAPTVGQRILNRCIRAQVDPEIYRARRDKMARVLKDAGISFHLPEGAFYFFPKSPIPDDVEFVRLLLNERVLAVPGRGFGMPGYVRLAFCVDDKTIVNSAASFQRAVQAAKGA